MCLSQASTVASSRQAAIRAVRVRHGDAARVQDLLHKARITLETLVGLHAQLAVPAGVVKGGSESVG